MTKKKTHKKSVPVMPEVKYCSCNTCNPYEDLIHACVPIFDEALKEIRRKNKGLKLKSNYDSDKTN